MARERWPALAKAAERVQAQWWDVIVRTWLRARSRDQRVAGLELLGIAIAMVPRELRREVLTKLTAATREDGSISPQARGDVAMMRERIAMAERDALASVVKGSSN